jgi:hypothetical protein
VGEGSRLRCLVPSPSLKPKSKTVATFDATRVSYLASLAFVVFTSARAANSSYSLAMVSNASRVIGSAVSPASVRASSARSRNCAGSWVGVFIPTHHATRDDVLARAADYVFAALPDLCAASKEFIALSNQ